MKENNLSQLVGALGGWLQARPYGVEQDALDRGARVVLDMRLLGIGLDDVDAPELAALDPEDRKVVDQARVWAQARREEARQRRVADERAARQRRVAERESGPNEAFAWPARASATPPIDATAAPLDTSDADDVTDLFSAAPAAAEQGLAGHELERERYEPAARSAQPDWRNSSAVADPDGHEFFENADNQGLVPTRPRRVRPEAVFKVVIIVWAIAALGVVAVLVRIALG